MFRYNPKVNYQPNGGRYLQILSGKDLYKQTIAGELTIVMSVGTHDTFPARFPNIFLDYPLGQMRVGDKLWTNWSSIEHGGTKTYFQYVGIFVGFFVLLYFGIFVRYFLWWGILYCFPCI